MGKSKKKAFVIHTRKCDEINRRAARHNARQQLEAAIRNGTADEYLITEKDLAILGNDEWGTKWDYEYKYKDMGHPGFIEKNRRK